MIPVMRAYGAVVIGLGYVQMFTPRISLASLHSLHFHRFWYIQLDSGCMYLYVRMTASIG